MNRQTEMQAIAAPYPILAKAQYVYTCLLALFHCVVRRGSVPLGSASFGSVCFSIAVSMGLETYRYNCTISMAVTSL